jgi:hypothetical protein
LPNPPNHRLFISRQNRAMVVDEVTGILGADRTAVAQETG